MPRVFDVTFYRILWVTLVALGLTFTVILTGVFVDIDALLAKRTNTVQNPSPPEAMKPVLPNFEEIQDFPQNDDSDEMDTAYRTKRSLESSNLLFHIKSPKMKSIITNRLATLLEELDEEESSQTVNTETLANNGVKDTDKSTFLSAEEVTQKKEDTTDISKASNNEFGKDANIKNKDVFHLAMHNILLQGIIGHMDLNDVYNKVHLLTKSFDSLDSNVKVTQEVLENKPNVLMKIIPQESYNEQNKFLDEPLKCKTLQKQISQNTESKHEEKNETITDNPIVIKAVIEITNKMMNDKYKTSNKNIKGLIKILFNGKPIKFEQLTDDQNTQTNTHPNNNGKKLKFDNAELTTEKIDTELKSDKKLDEAIAEYLKTHYVKSQNSHNLLSNDTLDTKRLKRQIKINYSNDGITTEKSKLKEKLKRHEEELFVEIETHFDGKGKKGEKKKKLVRNLIDKIQKAINSNIEVLQQDDKEDGTHTQIRKRTQNPIDYKEKFIQAPKAQPVEHRQLDPISKTANVMQPLTSVLDKSGEHWKRRYNGPGFLAPSKSLNSAEMNEMDVDYKSVMRNGIPKRLQKPMATESEGVIKHSDLSNVGNVTLFLKEIGGSGFSIGINQYTDEPPDKDALKIFSGLENLIQAYHEQYDQSDTDALSYDSADRNNILNNNNEIKIRDVSRHKRNAVNVKLFSNIKTKTKLNRYLNTNAMQRKKIILKSKRNKRHVDKIRIVATDHYPRSKENVYLVSHEDIFADRAIVKEGDPPEVEIADRDVEHNDFIPPYQNPYNADVPNFQPFIRSIYDTHSYHTSLMSKYPHVFVENLSKSKEEFVDVPPAIIENDETETVESHNRRSFDTTPKVEASLNANDGNVSSPHLEEMVNAILPSHTNYKLTVNILPKNKSTVRSGYKHVYTTINKSYDKNGVRYVSSVNVSEISKIENANKTETETESKETILTTEMPMNTKDIKDNKENQEENQIKLLLKLHKVRVDNQLEHLKNESQKLQQLIGQDDTENWNANLSQIRDVFKYLGLKHFYENISLTKFNENSRSKSENISFEYTTTVEPLMATTREDSEKIHLINTIKQNENITREILQKIDKNTNILQSFLQKVSDKILSDKSDKAPSIPAYLNPFVRHLEGNFTNAIPFVYAFQKPIDINNEKMSKNTASVVYHGHIHTDKAISNIGKRQTVKDHPVISNINEKIVTNNNDTRFFIDELENDYKLVPNVHDHFDSIKINTTTL